MGNKLYVGNLDFQTSSEELRELFAGAGEVSSAKVINDRDTQRSRGFAFVEMVNSETALKAISMFNGYNLNDRAMTVSEARPQEPRPIGDRPGRAGGGGSSGGGYSSGGRDNFRQTKHKRRGGRQQRRF